MARLVFLGTPGAAQTPLETLVSMGHDVALVVTQPDRRRSRGGGHQASPVKVTAQRLGIRVAHQLDDVLTSGAELGVVVAFGRIIPAAVLDAVPMVNLHFSLLPRWRGAAPVERAILEGDTRTGVCLMAVERGLDTGDVYAEESTFIDDKESADELRSRLVVMGCRLLETHLARGRAGLPVPKPQAGAPSYAEKIKPEELHLLWQRPAPALSRVVRLGRAWTTFRGERLLIARTAVVEAEEPPPSAGPPPEGREPRGVGECDPTVPGTLLGDVAVAGDGTRLRLVEVQPAGKPPMAMSSWLRGVRPQPGERLGSDR